MIFLKDRRSDNRNTQEANLMDRETIQKTSEHFLEFVITFLSLTKCQYQCANKVKINSLTFFTLIALKRCPDKHFTMSELADRLQITKQQLSRLINDLEDKGLVRRIHDTANRRRVYIQLSEQGLEMLDALKQDMLQSTASAMQAYSSEELADMDYCLCCLAGLMEKFHTGDCAGSGYSLSSSDNTGNT